MLAYIVVGLFVMVVAQIVIAFILGYGLGRRDIIRKQQSDRLAIVNGLLYRAEAIGDRDKIPELARERAMLIQALDL